MSLALVFCAVAVVALAWLAFKQPAPTLLLAVALAGLTAVGMLDFSLRNTDKVAEEAREVINDGATSVERATDEPPKPKRQHRPRPRD